MKYSREGTNVKGCFRWSSTAASVPSCHEYGFWAGIIGHVADEDFRIDADILKIAFVVLLRLFGRIRKSFSRLLMVKGSGVCLFGVKDFFRPNCDCERQSHFDCRLGCHCYCHCRDRPTNRYVTYGLWSCLGQLEIAISCPTTSRTALWHFF